MKIPLHFLACSFVSIVSLLADEPRVSLSEKGILIEADGFGVLTIEPPVLVLDSGKSEKPLFEGDGLTGKATYPGGTGVEIEVNGTEAEIRWSSAAADAKALAFSLNLPVLVNQGGRVAVGGRDPVDLPAEKGEKFVATGSNEGRVAVLPPGAPGLVIEAPTNWIAILDNRVFGMNYFSVQFLYDLRAKPGASSLRLRFFQQEEN
jgi:hypothetical protein